jgi:hypothetical protein
MNRLLWPLVAAALGLQGIWLTAYSTESTKVLVGVWIGKATGPQGGPPTGALTVTFEKSGPGLEGTIVVKGSGGGEYSGQVSNIELKDKIFSAAAVFKLGENPLEIRVSGPLKGKSIEGTFSVMSKGQKMGDGTFAITKSPTTKPAKKQ